MASKQSKIEIRLSARDELSLALRKAKAEVGAFAGSVSGATAPFRSLLSSALSLKTALGGLVAGAGGTAIGTTLIQEASKADTAIFNLQSSIQAANREFRVGGADQWGQQIKSLAAELKIYSETAVQQAAAKTIDMTKRLGLSEQQMVKVIRAAANLSAGKFELSNGVERVTAALRGEAEASEALGLTLSETYVKGWYEARGAQQGAWKDLDDLQKAQIRYNILLQQSDPLMGKAAKSAGTFGGVTTQLSTGLSTLETALGRVVTNNTFFVEALGKGATLLQSLANDATTNAGVWRLWAKESTLSVLQFVADTSTGFNDVYKSLSFLAGTLKLAYGGALTLGQGFQWLFEQANRLTGNTEKAAYWANAQVEATRLIDQAMAGAVKSFDNAEQGSQTLETVTTRIEALKAELAKLKTDEVNPVSGIAKQADVEFKQVGGRWIAVEKQIQESNQQTTKEVGVNWGNVWKDFEGKGLSAAEAVDKALDRAARDREVTLKVREVQTRATGGLIHRLASGGKLPGYGGGDRISALLEAGEYVIRKEAVAKFGSGLFHALNNLRIPEIPRFAAGGPVGGGDSMTVNLAFSGGSSVPVTSTREQARALIREFDRMGWRSSK